MSKWNQYVCGFKFHLIMVNKVVVTDLQQFCHKLVEHQVPVVRKMDVKDQKKNPN